MAVQFSLPQQQIMRVNAASAKGALAVDVFGNDGVTVIDSGKLAGIDNQVDSTTGTLKLKAEFPNGGFQLWPGQFVNVRLKVETISQALVVPTSAVQRGPVGTFSYVIGDGDIVAAKPVTVTQQNETQAVIASGLSANDRVVTTGFANLSDGAKVIVGKDDQTPSADLAPRKKGSRSPQTKDSPKDNTAKDGAASDPSTKDGQGKDGERRKRRSQTEGDPSGGGAKAQP
jgi:multidrug efflux system membrane fusion protein